MMTKHKPADPNIAELLKPLRKQGWYWDTETGKLASGPRTIEDDLPWITQNLDFDCYLWNRAFFHGVAQQKMVHTHCQTCFKVVVMPRNFLELLELEAWQESTDLRCKCGIEIRDYVSRTYGGYFYSWEPGELALHERLEPGELAVHERLEPTANQDVDMRYRFQIVSDFKALCKGRDKFKLIKFGMRQVLMNYLANWPDAPKLTEPMPVILKRGCTEFERDCGPTDQPRYRHISDEQIVLEDALKANIDHKGTEFVSTQPEAIKDAIRMRWAEWAHYIGDMTYTEWLGRSLSVPPVTYHEEG